MTGLPRIADAVGQTGEARSGEARKGAAEEGAEVREVTVRELSRATSAVIRELRDGRRLVLTRYGAPVGVLVSVADALELASPPDAEAPTAPIPRMAELREALARVVGAELERRLWRRELERLVHGRWFR